MNQYWLLIIAALVFLGSHIGITSTALRPVLVQRLGEKLYMGLYSLLSLVTIYWLVFVYKGMPASDLIWQPAKDFHWIAVILMPVILLLLTGGLLTPNPSLAGVTISTPLGDSAKGVLRITRHPVQWAILLWACVHILSTGDWPSLIFFGSLALLSGLGTVLIDRRKRIALGDQWEDFTAHTSNVPFAAIVQGRQRLVLSEIGLPALLLSIVLYVLLWAGHVWLEIGTLLVNPFA